MNIKFLFRKYYPTALLLIFVLSLLWGIGAIVSNNLAFAKNIGDSLKIAHLTDVHIDTASKDKAGRMLKNSSRLLKDALSQLSLIDNIDMVVFSGDVINRPIKKDLLHFLKIASSIKTPWYVALGNHDISVSGRLTKQNFMQTLKEHNEYLESTSPYYAVYPNKGFRVIFLDGVIDDKITAQGKFSQKQLSWLDKSLSSFENEKVIIVQHFPVIEPYGSENHKVQNDQQYLDILSRHNNVIAVISGHYHCARIQKRNNILHITTPALVQYPNAFRVLNFEREEKYIKVTSEFFETRLSEIRDISRKGVRFAAPLLNGMPSDRNSVFYLSN